MMRQRKAMWEQRVNEKDKKALRESVRKHNIFNVCDMSSLKAYFVTAVVLFLTVKAVYLVKTFMPAL